MKVLVTDGHLKCSLSAVRSLGRKGIIVHVTQQRSGATLCSASVYCQRSHVLPPYECIQDHDVQFLDLLNREKFDYIIHSSEGAVRSLSRNRDLIMKVTRVDLPPAPSLEVVLSKEELLELAKSIQIPVPNSVVYRTSSDLNAVLNTLKFPIVAKVTKGGTYDRVRYINSQRELEQYVSCLEEKDYVLFQEYIAGRGCAVFALFEHGKPVLTLMHERIWEYPTTGGPSVYAKTIADPTLEELGHRLLRRLDWNGLAMVEFKKSYEDNQYVLMEINPRLWGSLDLAVAAGADFPYLAVQEERCSSANSIKIRQTEFLWVVPDALLLGLAQASYALRIVKLLTSGKVKVNVWFDDLKPMWIQLREVSFWFKSLFLQRRLRYPHGYPARLRMATMKMPRSERLVDEKPMRVMHVVGQLGLAGMEYGVIKLVNRLDTKRFWPMICCLEFQRDASRSLLDARIPVFELRKRPGRELSLILRLADLLRRQCVDIVHSHNWVTFFYAVIAARIARVPVVIHGEHGRELGSVPYRQLVAQRMLAWLVTRLVAVSSDLSRELIDKWRVRPDYVTCIPNGVDLEVYGAPYSLDTLRRELQLKPNNSVVLSVGHLRSVKDHPTLIQAFAKVYAELSSARLLIVGEDTGIQTDLEKLSEELGARKTIIFTGIRQDVPELLALCDVYVNTSLFEGMSNTILEAMAAGKPVVATSVGGNPELVRNGVTGFLVSPGNDQELAKCMKHLLTDAELSKMMGAAGRKQVECEHQMSGMVKAYSDLYQELILRYHFKKHFRFRERAKTWIARGLRWSGLSRFKEMAGPRQLTILTYHRVLPLHEAVQYPFQGMVMPRDLFEAQIAYLQRHYRVLEFPQAISLLRRGELPRRSMVVTFDDGYRDNYEHALPILKKYKIPATFFLTTVTLDQQVRLWWDGVAEVIQQFSSPSVPHEERGHRLPDWMAALLWKLHSGGSPQTVAQEMVRRLNDLPLQERRRCLEALHALSDSGSNQQTDLMLTWEQVLLLQRCGMHIGAHTVNHAFLDELDEEVAWKEITESIRQLEEKVGCPVRLFAYPAGRFKEDLKKLLRNAGIEAAVLSEPGQNGPKTDLLQLYRIDVGYARLSKGFDGAVFEAELRGFFNTFRSS